MNQRRLLATSFIWNLTGNLVSKGSVFLTSILVARLMGVTEFGKVSLIQQTVALFSVFSVMGVSVTAIRYTAANLHAGRPFLTALVGRITWITGSLAGIVALVLFVFSNQLSVNIVNTRELAFAFKLSAVVLFFNSINSIQFGILSGLGEFRKIAISNVIAGVVSIPASIALVYWFHLEGYVFALIVSSVIILISNRIFIANSLKLKTRNENQIKEHHLASVMELLSFSIPNLLASLATTVSSWIIIVSLTKNAGLTDVSVLNAASQLFGIAYIVPTMLAQVVMSISASHPREKASILKDTICATMLFTLAICIPMFFMADHVMGLYGRSFDLYGSVLQVFLPILVVTSISNQIDHFAVGQGWIKQHFFLTVINCGLYVALSLNLMSFGVIAVALSRLIAVTAKLFLSIFIYRYLHVKSQKTIHS